MTNAAILCTGRLPESVRKALIAASETGEPDSLERRAAIEQVVREARLRYPAFFREP